MEDSVHSSDEDFDQSELMAGGEYRLSLVAQFDDLVRNQRVLSQGIEAEFYEFAANQLQNTEKWQKAEQDLPVLQEDVKNLRNDKTTLETKLIHARGQIDHEIRKRKRAEDERDDLERQVALVRELLNKKDNQFLSDQDREKLHFLSTDFQYSNYDQSPKRRRSKKKSRSLHPIGEQSHSLLSDISYDKTEEDLETSYLRSGKSWKRPRPSAPPEEAVLAPSSPRTRTRTKSGDKRHRHRRSKSAGTIVTTNININDEGEVQAEAEISANGKTRRIHTPSHTPSRRSMKKYHSVGNVTTDDDDPAHRSPQALIKELNSHLSTPLSSGLRRHGSKGNLGRKHVLVSKKIYWAETCWPCGKKISFGKYAMKCKECRACAHMEHKDDLPLPCIPTITTPASNKQLTGLLSDYAPCEPPMIPALVIHCVNEIEHRGLRETGIYRVPGSEREVRELKEKFMKNKGVPFLSNVADIHVVCGCVKDFLRGLKEPLITHALWEAFVTAAECVEEEGESRLVHAVSQLPQANRDTLAFMMLHLQRVAESDEAKMPATNVARVFGPTIVGYSSPDVEPQQMVSETRRSHLVIERLLALSSDYWENFINVVDEEWVSQHHPLHRDITSTPQTPEKKPCEYESILGPLGTPTMTPTHIANETAKRGWLTTPRFGNKNRNGKKSNHFFASPTLK